MSKEAAQRVVFSGVGKKAEEMDAALRAGILIFNVESELRWSCSRSGGGLA